MKRRKIIKCCKCKEGLFYLPDGYEMDIDIECLYCAKGKTRKKKSVRTASGNYARTKKGVRKDIHPTYMFRSATEANFARIMNYHNIEWKYEEHSFTFSGYKTKPYVYIMDFEILSSQDAPNGLLKGFYEIKGYMTPDSRKKLRRLKKNYPEHFKNTCVVVYSKYKKKDIEFCKGLDYRVLIYKDLEVIYKDLIPEWE